MIRIKFLIAVSLFVSPCLSQTVIFTDIGTGLNFIGTSESEFIKQHSLERINDPVGYTFNAYIGFLLLRRFIAAASVNTFRRPLLLFPVSQDNTGSDLQIAHELRDVSFGVHLGAHLFPFLNKGWNAGLLVGFGYLSQLGEIETRRKNASGLWEAYEAEFIDFKNGTFAILPELRIIRRLNENSTIYLGLRYTFHFRKPFIPYPALVFGLTLSFPFAKNTEQRDKREFTKNGEEEEETAKEDFK